MLIPRNVIMNADDLGLNNSVNEAILYCFENGYINSTSLITNTSYFGQTVALIHENQVVNNIGVHVNMAEGKPLTNVIKGGYLDDDGNWDINKINSKLIFFNAETKRAFTKEISAQIEKALSSKISIVHLDAHYHLHTLPCFFQLFLAVAKTFKLKLRLAQTYNEGNYLKFLYREHINHLFKKSDVNYSDNFETVEEFLKKPSRLNPYETVEIMVHPDFDEAGMLTDHYDPATIIKWLDYLRKESSLV